MDKLWAKRSFCHWTEGRSDCGDLREGYENIKSLIKDLDEVYMKTEFGSDNDDSDYE